jgi:hypothetical protein
MRVGFPTKIDFFWVFFSFSTVLFIRYRTEFWCIVSQLLIKYYSDVFLLKNCKFSLYSASGGDYWRLLTPGEYEVGDILPFYILVAVPAYTVTNSNRLTLMPEFQGGLTKLTTGRNATGICG